MNSHKTQGAWLLVLLVAGLVFMASVLPAAAATVSVYTDVTYTDTNLVATIYANIDATDGDPLVSSGVKLFYDLNELSKPAAVKNQDVWYFGTSSSHFSYFPPDISVPGEVIFILGRLDSSETMQTGVSGSDVLLGTVTLDRATTTLPVGDPSALFGIAVSLGRDRTAFPDYVNFASLAKDDLDLSVVFNSAVYSATIILQGDINGDGVVDVLDYNILRANFGQTGANQADINGDDVVDVLDYNILRAHFGETSQ